MVVAVVAGEGAKVGWEEAEGLEAGQAAAAGEEMGDAEDLEGQTSTVR